MPRSPSPTSRSSSVSSSRCGDQRLGHRLQGPAHRVVGAAACPVSGRSPGGAGDGRVPSAVTRCAARPARWSGRPGRRAGRRRPAAGSARRRPCPARSGSCRPRAGPPMMPRSRRSRTAASATMDSSIGGVAPRPLTSSATRLPAGDAAVLDDRGRAAARPPRRPGAARPRSTPGSPWMPRPHSISSSSSRKPGCPAAGTVHGAERQAHRADRVRDPLGPPGDLGQRQARLGRGARRPCAPAPCRRCRGGPAPDLGGQGHVVGDHHGRHLDALGAGQLGGEPEVEPVAGVVLDDQQDAAGGGDRPDRVQHGVDRRGGEDLARHRAGQHARRRRIRRGPARARRRRRRAGPPAGRAHGLDVAADRGGGAGQAGDAGRGERESVQGFADDVAGRIDELLHPAHSPAQRRDIPAGMRMRVHSISSERRRAITPPGCAEHVSSSRRVDPAGAARP